jgi:CRP/FNR family transcriptional regulator, cyclic AMP receptor protein
VALFAGCSKKELAAIARASDRLDVEDGTALTRQGESSREAFVIVDGKAVVRRNDRQVGVLGPGDAVGELGLLDRGPRTATVVADGPVRALVIGPREFAALLDEVPSISRKLMQTMSGRIRELDAKNYG